MKKYRYDAFISYSSKNKNEVIELNNLLRRRVSVFFDDSAINYGNEITFTLQDALSNSRHIIACFTNEYFVSDWVKKELFTILFKDPLNRQNRILPILLKPCNIPEFYSSYKFIDLTKDFHQGIEEIVSYIQQSNTLGLPKHKSKALSPKDTISKISQTLIDKIDSLNLLVIEMLKKGAPYSVIYLDIDNFTLINIVHGRMVGEEILSQIASIHLEESVIITHWNADEFVLLCKNSSMEKAHKICEKIINFIKLKDWRSICDNLYVSATIGYAAGHKKGSEFDGFFYTLERAILGCKKAKQAGKGMIGLGPIYLIGNSKEEKMLLKEERVTRYTIDRIMRRYSSSSL